MIIKNIFLSLTTVLVTTEIILLIKSLIWPMVILLWPMVILLIFFRIKNQDDGNTFNKHPAIIQQEKRMRYIAQGLGQGCKNEFFERRITELQKQINNIKDSSNEIK